MTEPIVSGNLKVTSDRPAPKVMVVDDSRNAAEILAMFFEMEGMETAVAFDGLEALDTAKTFLPDLVFMDLTMPRMDGFEAAGHLRTAMPQVTLVALTGWESGEDRQRAAEAGFHLHMVKPVKPEELRKLVADYRSSSLGNGK